MDFFETAFCLMAAFPSIWESGLAMRFLQIAGPCLRWGAILLLAVLFPVFILEYLEELVAEIVELLSFIPMPSLPFVPDETQRLLKSTVWYICSGTGTILGFLVFTAIFFVAIIGIEQIFIHTPRLGLSAIRWIIKKSKPTRLVPELNGIHNSNLAPYKYKSLESRRDIRLLILNPGRDIDEISCCLSRFSLDENPKYEALSYVWGDLSNTRIILCSDGMVQITFNLYTALWHLRYRDRQRVLWADALCINQQDLKERTQQVRVMPDIYSHANQALVWLGEELEHVRDSLEKIEHAASFFPSPKTAHDYFGQVDPRKSAKDDSLLLDSVRLSLQEEANILDFSGEPLANLLRNPYFHRKWVIQEIVNSERALMLCGDKQLDWECMAGLVIHMCLRGFLNLIPSFSLKDERTAPTSSAGISIQNIMCMDMIREGYMREIFHLLYVTRQFQCSNPSDHVISILGLASDIDGEDLDLLTDYTVTPGEIYKRLTVWSILKKESLLLLSFTSNPDIASTITLPSWIPDFSRLDSGNMLPSYDQSVFAAAGDSHVSAHLSNDNTVLHLSGKAIDSVHSLGQNLLRITPTLSKTSTHSDKKLAEMEFYALRFRAWIKECYDLALDEEETMSPQRLEAFWKTLTCDLANLNERASPDFLHLVARCMELVLDEGFLDSTWQPEATLDVVQVEQSLVTVAVRRRFCTTRHGRLGLMPLNAEVGDVMCVFYGGRVPYLIRPSDNGQYIFIGHCYVHGFMDGEAMEMSHIETQEFTLH